MNETNSDSRPSGLPVVVCSRNAIFFGYCGDTTATPLVLRNARNAYYYHCTEGLLELGAKGPGADSKIGARADIELRDVTCVIACSPAAVDRWESATWKR